MSTRTARRVLISSTVSLLVLSSWPSPVAALTQVVDCSRGQKIANVLKLAVPLPLVITIRGTCNENVVISRDDVTLKGDSTTASIIAGTAAGAPAIGIDAARRIVIDTLTVKGAGPGIGGARGARHRHVFTASTLSVV